MNHNATIVRDDTAEFAPSPLALSPKNAAKALGIGVRTLWSKTNAGEVPHVRIGRRIVYPIELLQEWLREQTKKKGGGR